MTIKINTWSTQRQYNLHIHIWQKKCCQRVVKKCGRYYEKKGKYKNFKEVPPRKKMSTKNWQITFKKENCEAKEGHKTPVEELKKQQKNQNKNIKTEINI